VGPPVRESWAIAVREALAGLSGVLVAQVVPGAEGWKLVLTTGSSPPPEELVDELVSALDSLLSREDSPLVTDERDGGGLHFYPPVDEQERRLFDRLEWKRAVVLHEFVD
jgi:hypothetical protein